MFGDEKVDGKLYARWMRIILVGDYPWGAITHWIWALFECTCSGHHRYIHVELVVLRLATSEDSHNMLQFPVTGCSSPGAGITVESPKKGYIVTPRAHFVDRDVICRNTFYRNCRLFNSGAGEHI
jgi:hypothetical protein